MFGALVPYGLLRIQLDSKCYAISLTPIDSIFIPDGSEVDRKEFLYVDPARELFH